MSLVIDDKELVDEFVKRVVPGLAKAAKAMCPTQEGMDGKRGHVDVPIAANTLYVGKGLAPYVGRASVDLTSFCKKKSKLRDLLPGVSIRAGINYGDVNAWLKLNGPATQRVTIAEDHVLLTCVEGVVELRLQWRDEFQRGIDEVEGIIATRILDENFIASCEIEDKIEQSQVVVAIGTESVEVRDAFVTHTDDTQIRLRPGLVPPGRVTLAAYHDPEGDRIVHLQAVDDGQTVDQFYRVLQL